jgi:hypothetical protein
MLPCDGSFDAVKCDSGLPRASLLAECGRCQKCRWLAGAELRCWESSGPDIAAAREQGLSNQLTFWLAREDKKHANGLAELVGCELQMDATGRADPLL